MSKFWIAQTQKILKDEGLYNGDIDGLWGEKSYNAVANYFEKQKPVSNDVSQGVTVNKNLINKPLWIVEAEKHIGTKEIRGVRNNPKILSWIKNLGGWFTNDEVPWCGTFVAQCLTVGQRAVPKHWYRALAYLNYGTKLKKPAYGSIGVKTRSGGGHVTFIVGITKDGRYLVGLGGNQSDAVNLMKFPISSFEAFIFPPLGNGVKSSPYPYRYDLPVYSNDLKVSTKES